MASDNQMQPVLSIREVARLLNMHSNTVRRWSDKGIITAYRINDRGDRRFRQEDIARILLELKTYRGNPKKAEPLP